MRPLVSVAELGERDLVYALLGRHEAAQVKRIARVHGPPRKPMRES